jgi:hypothetical protein
VRLHLFSVKFLLDVHFFISYLAVMCSVQLCNRLCLRSLQFMRIIFLSILVLSLSLYARLHFCLFCIFHLFIFMFSCFCLCLIHTLYVVLWCRVLFHCVVLLTVRNFLCTNNCQFAVTFTFRYPIYFSYRTAGYRSVSGRYCDRPSRHRFFLVSLCL